MKILHITPHFGGGVGTVIIDWIKADKKNDHTVFCLDYINNKVKNEMALHPLLIKQISVTDVKVYEWDDYDVVLVHFWDHPLLDQLFEKATPPCRLIFWCHKNYELLDYYLKYPDLLIGTAPCQHQLKDHIWSTRNMKIFDVDCSNKRKDCFRVGFVGSQKKISDNFLTAVAMLPDVEFVFIGMEQTRIMATFMNIVTIEEITDDRELAKHYNSFSVFGYPLSRDHYGTCEQVIGEAMRSGCVPVVLNNECETNIISNGNTGYIANSIEDYVTFIKILRDYPEIRENMSYQAWMYSTSIYDHGNMMNEWNDVFINMMRRKKRIHK